VCDATKDCMDGSDEYNCTAQCWPSKACLPDGKCKPGYFGCDSGEFYIRHVLTHFQMTNC